MRSSIVAIVVFVLGLSATAYSANQCNVQCTQTGNGTDGVQIQYGEDITITVSKTENVIVIVNQRAQLVIVLDTKASLVLIYRFNASFGIVINVKTGGCVKVQLDITLVIDGDYTALRSALDKANADISANGATVVIINLTYIQSATFVIENVFSSGSQTIIAEIQVSYTFVFQASFQAGVTVGRDINFIGGVVLVVFVRVTEVSVGVANSVALVVGAGVSLSYDFGVFIVSTIRTASVKIFLEFKAAFIAFGNNVNEAIANIKNGVSIDTSLTVGSIKFRFVLVLVKEYLEFALTLGSINIDIGYSGRALAVYNARANIAYVIYGSYYFLYSYELKAGFLIKGSNLVYVTVAVIQGKIGTTTVINSGTLALFVNNHAEAVFTSSTKISLKDFKAAFASQSTFETFAKANGIANGSATYKVFASYARCVSNILFIYSFDVILSLRVSFSLTASYELDLTSYNNIVVIGIATALKVVTTFVAAAAVFAAVKIVIGGKSSDD